MLGRQACTGADHGLLLHGIMMPRNLPARPSACYSCPTAPADAINLAVRFGAAIYVNKVRGGVRLAGSQPASLGFADANGQQQFVRAIHSRRQPRTCRMPRSVGMEAALTARLNSSE